MKPIRTQWKTVPPSTLAELAERKAREQIVERMTLPLLTFEAFCEREKSTGQHATVTA